MRTGTMIGPNGTGSDLDGVIGKAKDAEVAALGPAMQKIAGELADSVHRLIQWIGATPMCRIACEPADRHGRGASRTPPPRPEPPPQTRLAKPHTRCSGTRISTARLKSSDRSRSWTPQSVRHWPPTCPSRRA